MTPLPTPDSLDSLDVGEPLGPELQATLETAGLTAVLAEITRPACERVTPHLADPMATDSRTSYAAWLRRQIRAWSALRLPAVSVAAVDWPLASVRAQCLDIVGLLVADLREIAPRTRPAIVPAPAMSIDLPQAGIIMAATDLCVRLAAAPAQLLAPARALTEGPTHLHSATRYLTRCSELAERAPGLASEVDRWAGTAEPAQIQLAVVTAQHLADRLAHAFGSQVGTGW